MYSHTYSSCIFFPPCICNLLHVAALSTLIVITCIFFKQKNIILTLQKVHPSTKCSKPIFNTTHKEQKSSTLLCCFVCMLPWFSSNFFQSMYNFISYKYTVIEKLNEIKILGKNYYKNDSSEFLNLSPTFFFFL